MGSKRRVKDRWAMRAMLAVCVLWAVALLPADVGWSQSAAVVYQGSWTASAGGDQYLRGTWSGQISGASRNAGQGSWTLVNEAGEVLMSGTWSARKSTQDWEGTWTAKVAGGGSLSGMWSADLKTSDGKTLEDMLARTMQKQVAGGWQSGRRHGFWWLEGAGGKKKR